ncbi:MAG: DNA polymerase III subunit delta [Mucinivorans sp.]
MNFSQINGHSVIKKRLIDAISVGRVSHAQMFVGDSSSGALAMAVAYARAVMCPNSGSVGQACQACPTCYRTQKMEHPDLNFIFPVNKSKKGHSTGRADEKPTSDQFIHLWREFFASKNGVFTEREWYDYIEIDNAQGTINVTEADELIRKMSYKSYEGGYKVVIIYLPERMNEQAANRLLKLIEEPAPKTLFLFVSENIDAVMLTIRSRCQTIVLPSIGLGGGEGSAQFYDQFVKLMRMCYASQYLDLFAWADSMATSGREAHKAFCAESINLLRSCYLQGIGLGALAPVEADRQKFVQNFAPYVNHLTVEPLVSAFELLSLHVRGNGNARILFTHFALSVIKILSSVHRNVAVGK